VRLQLDHWVWGMWLKGPTNASIYGGTTPGRIGRNGSPSLPFFVDAGQRKRTMPLVTAFPKAALRQAGHHHRTRSTAARRTVVVGFPFSRQYFRILAHSRLFVSLRSYLIHFIERRRAWSRRKRVHSWGRRRPVARRGKRTSFCRPPSARQASGRPPCPCFQPLRRLVKLEERED
jgi:hypothetical protein